MIAYNPTFIRNSAIVKKSKQWFSKNLLTAEQMNTISANYITGFYSPNFFIKTGLFLFTFIAISASFGFFSLLYFTSGAHSEKFFFTFSSLLFSGICIFFLEFFIRQKNVYRAGVDECLLYAALSFIFTSIGIITNIEFETSNDFLLFCFLAVPFLIAAVVRYTDQLVTLALGVALYLIFFLSLLKLGHIAKQIMPFALMLISVPVYLTAIKQKQRKELFHWKQCFTVFECLALIIFYLAGNYFVIRESSIAFFDMQLTEGQNIPLAFVFYILTALVPVLYIYYGLKRKDKTLLWTGLILVTAAVLTFKYYFSLGHPEITLTLAGSILITIAYLGIKFLKTPKHGITFEEGYDEDSFLKSNAEALVIAQQMGGQHQQTQTQSSPEFGGGGFGGAGSGGNF
ncbi:MAG: hypothetical protein V4608_16305 [Bacteroidota bacterium]